MPVDIQKLTAALAVVARAVEEGTIRPVVCPKRAWIVLRHPSSPTPMELAELQQRTEAIFGDRRVIILTEGIAMSVVEPAEKPLEDEVL